MVEDATTVTVVLSNEERLDAEVLGYSSWDDVALLKVDAASVSGIQPLALADSSLVKPGQMAVAIGSPHGLENTVTVGVVSGIERTHGRRVSQAHLRNDSDGRVPHVRQLGRPTAELKW